MKMMIPPSLLAVANKIINTVIRVMLGCTLYHNDECSILKYQCLLLWRDRSLRIHLQFINNSKQYRTQVVDGQRVGAGGRQIRVDGQARRSRQAAGIVIGETVRVIHRQAEQTGNKRSEVITGANQDFALRCRNHSPLWGMVWVCVLMTGADDQSQVCGRRI